MTIVAILGKRGVSYFGLEADLLHSPWCAKTHKF